MDTKTKLLSIIVFSYISIGLLILIPLGLNIFAVFTIPNTFSWTEIIFEVVFGLTVGTLLWAFVIWFEPFLVLTNFSNFIQTISVREVGFLFISLLNWVSLILIVWGLIKFRHDFKVNKDIQKLKIHLKIIKIILGVYIGLLIVRIILIFIPGHSY